MNGQPPDEKAHARSGDVGKITKTKTLNDKHTLPKKAQSARVFADKSDVGRAEKILLRYFKRTVPKSARHIIGRNHSAVDVGEALRRLEKRGAIVQAGRIEPKGNFPWSVPSRLWLLTGGVAP